MALDHAMECAISCPQGQGHGGASTVGGEIVNSTQTIPGFIETKAFVRFYSCAMTTAAQPPALAKNLLLMLLPRLSWVGSETHQSHEHSHSARAGSGQG